MTDTARLNKVKMAAALSGAAALLAAGANFTTLMSFFGLARTAPANPQPGTTVEAPTASLLTSSVSPPATSGAPATIQPTSFPTPSNSFAPISAPTTSMSGNSSARATTPARPDAMAVKTDRGDNAWGYQVGPNMIQMGQFGADIAVAWELRSNGVPIQGPNCQILVSITGPNAPGAKRSANCSEGNDITHVRSSHVAFNVRTAGQYTVTVTDEISGILGKQVVTILPMAK